MKHRFYAQEARSDYRPIVVYERARHKLGYFDEILVTGMNQQENRRLAAEMKGKFNVPKSGRVSTLADEIQIYFDLAQQKKSDENVRRASAYSEILNRESTSPIIVTDTTLSIPENMPADKSEYKAGKRFYRRLVKEHGEVVGEILVPETIGKHTVTGSIPVYDALDLVFGVPRELTTDNTLKHDFHFYYDPELQDAALTLTSDPQHFREPRCIAIQARPAEQRRPRNGFRLAYYNEAPVRAKR